MEFFHFIQKESGHLDRRLFAAGAFAGIVNMILIFILTASANRAARGEPEFRELLMVALCLGAFWISKGHLMDRATVLVEEIIENVRRRIAAKIRGSDLASIEAIGQAPLVNAISTHAGNISRAATGVVSAGTSAVLLCCALLVVFFLSATAFCILIATMGFISVVFMVNRGKIMAGYARVADEENQYTRAFTDLIDGFKELKMNSAANREFFEGHLNPIGASSRSTRVDTGRIVNQSVLLATSALFILLAAVVFLVPVLTPADAPRLVRISTLIIFIFGPLGEIFSVFPLFSEAVGSIRELRRIEDRLDDVYKRGLEDPILGPVSPLPFNRIHCDGLAFSYRDEKGAQSFTLEPFEFTLARGELVFITGGNGSGKSTFLKVFAGLYPPAGGRILVDDVPVGPANRQAYRDLFNPIFADFHLFDRIHGTQLPDETRVRSLIDRMGLTEKVALHGRRISTTQLSTGQRRRLALVLAWLDPRPILLLDEWAAEQDPDFRRKFYRELLGDLRAEGRTIVAVTHDDDHYDVADRVLKMQYGRFVPQPPPAAARRRRPRTGP